MQIRFGTRTLDLAGRLVAVHAENDALTARSTGATARDFMDSRPLIAELEAILADPAERDKLLVSELRALRRAHADPRRSRRDGRGPADDDPDEQRKPDLALGNR